MGLVIYLTGAPASGKSTLTRNLARVVPGLRVFSFSESLRAYLLQRKGESITEDDIRQKSAMVVSKEDVDRVDDDLLSIVKKEREHRSIIVDSHPVTKEYYGFRVTAFSVEKLKELAPDVILCLYLDSAKTKARIQAAAMGRPLPTLFELNMHCFVQSNLAVQYGLILGKPVYLLDSSVSEEELVKHVLERLKLPRA